MIFWWQRTCWNCLPMILVQLKTILEKYDRIQPYRNGRSPHSDIPAGKATRRLGRLNEHCFKNSIPLKPFCSSGKKLEANSLGQPVNHEASEYDHGKITPLWADEDQNAYRFYNYRSFLYSGINLTTNYIVYSVNKNIGQIRSIPGWLASFNI